jgi:hypothetical protein
MNAFETVTKEAIKDKNTPPLFFTPTEHAFEIDNVRTWPVEIYASGVSSDLAFKTAIETIDRKTSNDQTRSSLQELCFNLRRLACADK